MTREEAVKVLKRTVGNINWDAKREEIYFTDEWVQAYEMAIAALKEQEKLESKLRVFESSGWISVKDRLPKYGERVLITEGHGVFEASLSISRKWVRCGIGWTEGVTHWKPMPEPPEVDV